MVGYSEKTAYPIGQENLKKPEIKKAIDEAIEAQIGVLSLMELRYLKNLESRHSLTLWIMQHLKKTGR